LILNLAIAQNGLFREIKYQTNILKIVSGNDEEALEMIASIWINYQSRTA
jgi:hypothetical protein